MINSGTVPSDCWNACAVPWKLEFNVAGAPSSDHRLLDGVGRLPERHALAEVEADGDGRELTLVADRERRTGTLVQVANVDNGT